MLSCAQTIQIQPETDKIRITFFAAKLAALKERMNDAEIEQLHARIAVL